jgi:dihydrofolate reductase
VGDGTGQRTGSGADGSVVIRAIAAIDDKLGLSTDTGIPWHVQADIDYFRTTTRSASVLMGSATYREFKDPMSDRVNYVATRSATPLRPGFTPVGDVAAFVDAGIAGDLWVIGGANLFATTLHRMEELYLTRVEGDFHCTKFFPPFEDAFELSSDRAVPAEPGTPAIRFQVWRRVTS